MRLIAITNAPIEVYDAPNSLSSIVGSVEKSNEVVVIDLKYDGVVGYYRIEKPKGYVKKDLLTIARDEEFYYNSKLLKIKSNRSSNSKYHELELQLHASLLSKSLTQVGASLALAKLSKSNTVNKIGKALSSAGFGSDGWVDNSDIPLVMGKSGDEADESLKGSSFGKAIGTIASTINTIATKGISGVLDTLVDTAIKRINEYLRTIIRKINYIIGVKIDGSGTTVGLLSRLGLSAMDAITNLGEELKKTYKPSKAYNNFSDLEIRMGKYFEYKGAFGQKKVRYTRYSRETGINEGNGGTYYQKWEQDAYYNTEYEKVLRSGVKDPEQVKMFKTQYESLYTEFKSAIDVVHDTVNLNITRNDWYVNFNRYRLTHPDTMLTNSKGYIFFTRPDLNISTDLSPSDIGLLFHNMAHQHADIVQQLRKDWLVPHKFMPLLCNRCTGIDIQNESLEMKEVHETLTGWKLNYADNLIKSKSSGSVSTSFIDDDQLSVYLLFKLWCEYISAVSRGVVKPVSKYIRQHILDYAISIYYFLTASDGESIIFWTKYTGCIPTVIPSSNFSDNLEDRIKLPKYSIDWTYAFKKDYDPYSLAEFNNLSKGSDYQYVESFNPDTTRSSKTISGAPFVDTNTDGRLFKLRFRPQYTSNSYSILVGNN